MLAIKGFVGECDLLEEEVVLCVCGDTLSSLCENVRVGVEKDLREKCIRECTEQKIKALEELKALCSLEWPDESDLAALSEGVGGFVESMEGKEGGETSGLRIIAREADHIATCVALR